jgi:hypothetical protein
MRILTMREKIKDAIYNYSIPGLTKLDPLWRLPKVKKRNLFERRWIKRGDGMPPDLESTTYLSRTGRRVTVRLWRTIKGDAVLIHQYRVPGCKRCRRTRFNHHSLCPFYKESRNVQQ